MNDDDIFAPWSEPAPPPSKQAVQGAQTATDRPPYSHEALAALGDELLYNLACDVADTPHAFKPNERLAITREVQDRTKGKAAQSITVDTKATVTHEHVMKLPADEAYRLLIEGDKTLTGLPVLDAEPVRGGGDTRELAAGDVVGEATSNNTPDFGEK